MLVVALLVLPALAGYLGLWAFLSGESKTKKDEAHAEELLDEIFDGSPTVIHSPQTSHLRFETLVRGASDRGYELTHSEGHEIARTHVFKKIDPPTINSRTQSVRE